MPLVAELLTIKLIDDNKTIIIEMNKAFDINQKTYIPSCLTDYFYPNNKSPDFIIWLKKELNRNNSEYEYQYYFLKNDNTIVGYLLLCADSKAKVIYISHLYILEEYRNKGYAKEALQLLKDDSKTLKNWTLVLSVFDQNKAKKLYQSVGFKSYSSQMYL